MSIMGYGAALPPATLEFDRRSPSMPYGVTPEPWAVGEADSSPDDRSVMRAPGVHRVALESVPGLERLERDVARLRKGSQEHRLANLILCPRDLPDTQVVD